MNYLEDLKIDESNLHEIVDTQAYTSMSYHEIYIDKLNELKEQERKVDIIKAELKEVYARIFLFNSEIKTKEGKNPTLPILEAKVLVDSEYKEKQKEYFDEIKKANDLEKDVNILEGVVKNFQQRKNMIEKKVELFNMGINSNVRQKSTDSTKNDILDKLNRSK